MSITSKHEAEKLRADDPRWAFHISTQTPEQLLEDLWPFFDMTPEERDLECQAVCRYVVAQWNTLPEDVRERAEWFDEYSKRDGMAILAKWAREYRERGSSTI
ncbi:MAG: hypothetical protein AAB434_00875 [Planctomycetota bacterium]